MERLGQLAKWQKDELAGQRDFVVLAVMSLAECSSEDLIEWQEGLDLDAVSLHDPEEHVASMYNVPYDSARALLIDKKMVIRELVDLDEAITLAAILKLLEE